ncbi:AAA family ATPase [Bacillus velezensis]|nr:AAA family ATPase [Bacillus velezensis]
MRPKSFQDIVGQEDGIKALKRRFADRTRKDVIIYGPPGVGKTGAARLVLEEAKNINSHRFKSRLYLLNLMRRPRGLMNGDCRSAYRFSA